MAFNIAQDFEYKGDDWWEWWVWLEGSDTELDNVDYVVYKLHPTFPSPVRKIFDRSNKFRLKTAGWGIFRLFVKVVLKDKKEINLEHNLKLEYPNNNNSPKTRNIS